MHIHVIFLIYSSVVGNLGCFLMCAIEEDNATMNAGCKYLFEILISTLLDIIAKSETAGSYGILLLVFEETPYCFPWGNMDIPRGHHTKCNKLVTKVLPDSTYRKLSKTVRLTKAKDRTVIVRSWGMEEMGNCCSMDIQFLLRKVN